MVTELVKPDNAAIDPRARRYTAEERAGAYLLWRTTCGRSLRKVSARLNISMPSLIAWKRDDGWESLADQEDHDDFSSSRLGVAAIVVNELVPSIEEAVRIRDHGTDDKVRLQAAQWLAGLAGVSPVSKIETSVVQAPKSANSIIDVQSLATMSPEQLMQLEQETRQKRKS